MSFILGNLWHGSPQSLVPWVDCPLPQPPFQCHQVSSISRTVKTEKWWPHVSECKGWSLTKHVSHQLCHCIAFHVPNTSPSLPYTSSQGQKEGSSVTFVTFLHTNPNNFKVMYIICRWAEHQWSTQINQCKRMFLTMIKSWFLRKFVEYYQMKYSLAHPVWQ